VGYWYRAGQQVQEIGGLKRKGKVYKTVQTGPYSRIYVQITGVGIVAFYPAQIRAA
jgi:hypothetical protein